MPLAAFGGLVLLGGGQLLPLPESLLQIVSPVNLTIYHRIRDTLAAFGAAAPLARISIGPFETAGALLLALAEGALFLSAANLVRSRLRRRLFTAVVVLAAVVSTGWVMGSASLGRSGGAAEVTAARLEIAFALGFGVVWAEILTGARRSPSAADPADRIEGRILPLAGPSILWLGLAALIAWTGSLWGTVAAVLTGLVLPLAANRHHRARGRWGATIAMALGATAVLIATFALTSGGRFALGSAALRRASVDAWKQFPLVGSGFGTFAEGFARAQPESLPGRVNEAGCDLLQMLVTGGLAGGALVLVLVGSLLVLLVQAWWRQRHREESAYALAGAGALFSLLIHGLGASVLSDPGVAACLAAVLGAAWTAGPGDSRSARGRALS